MKLGYIILKSVQNNIGAVGWTYVYGWKETYSALLTVSGTLKPWTSHVAVPWDLCPHGSEDLLLAAKVGTWLEGRRGSVKDLLWGRHFLRNNNTDHSYHLHSLIRGNWQIKGSPGLTIQAAVPFFSPILCPVHNLTQSFCSMKSMGGGQRVVI